MHTYNTNTQKEKKNATRQAIMFLRTKLESLVLALACLRGFIFGRGEGESQ